MTFFYTNFEKELRDWMHQKMTTKLQKRHALLKLYVFVRVKNDILDLINFITLINKLIKCDNDKLNVCNQVCVY